MSRGRRRLIVAALLGAGVGALWGIADTPTYTATATVVLSSPAGETDPSDYLPEPPDAGALLSIAESEQVARAAAGLAGGDLPGADLLAMVSARAGDRDDTVELVADSETPDFAAAAADAYAAALVDVAGADWRRRLNRLLEATIDPARAALLRERLAFGLPLTVGAAAVLPSEPSEDRSATLWALFGAGLGLLAAALTPGLSRRPRRRPATDEQLPPELPPSEPEPSVATAEPPPSEPAPPEPKRRRRVRRSSPTQVLFSPDAFAGAADAPIEIGRDDLEQARDLAAALGLDRRAGSVCIAGPLRSDGRTTIATALTVAAALSGVRTLLVEADLRHPALSARLGLAPAPGLVEYLSGVAGPAEVSRAVELADPDNGARTFACVPSGAVSGDAADLLGSDRVRELAARLERVYETVIFDTPAALSYPDAAQIAVAVGQLIVCVRPGLEERSTVRELTRVLGVEPAGFVEVAR